MCAHMGLRLIAPLLPLTDTLLRAQNAGEQHVAGGQDNELGRRRHQQARRLPPDLETRARLLRVGGGVRRGGHGQDARLGGVVASSGCPSAAGARRELDARLRSLRKRSPRFSTRLALLVAHVLHRMRRKGVGAVVLRCNESFALGVRMRPSSARPVWVNICGYLSNVRVHVCTPLACVLVSQWMSPGMPRQPCSSPASKDGPGTPGARAPPK
jgi:hypothetical protein